MAHLSRKMISDRGTKRAFFRQPTFHRLVGRPRYCWQDLVKEDLQELEARNWRATKQHKTLIKGGISYRMSKLILGRRAIGEKVSITHTQHYTFSNKAASSDAFE